MDERQRSALGGRVALRAMQGLAVLGITTVATILGVAPTAHARDPFSAPEAAPSAAFALPELVVIRGETASDTLTLANPGTSKVTLHSPEILDSTHLTVDGLDAAIRDGTVLAPGQVVEVPLEVTVDDAFTDAKAAFTAVATLTPAMGPETSIALNATLAVTTSDLKDAVTTTVLDLPTGLHDGQQVSATVQVANQLPQILKTVAVTPISSADVHLTLACKDAENCSITGRVLTLTDLAARGSALVKVTYKVDPSVRTGTQQVALEVTTDRDGPGTGTSSTILTKNDITLSVYGIDFVSPYGVTALVLMPGLVALGLFGALIKLYPGGKGAAQFPDAKSPLALLLIPPVSAGVIAAFIAVGLKVDDRAGTSDVVALFIAGLAVGLVAWGITAAVYGFGIGRKVLKTKDSPAKVLQRLGRRGADPIRPKITAGGQTFLQLHATADTVWACSPIKVEIPPGANAGTVETEVSKAEKAKDLKTIGELGAEKKIDLSWTGSGVVALDASKVTPTADKDELLDLKLPAAAVPGA